MLFLQIIYVILNRLQKAVGSIFAQMYFFNRLFFINIPRLPENGWTDFYESFLFERAYFCGGPVVLNIGILAGLSQYPENIIFYT